MADKFRFNRPPETDDELWWTVNALWGVTIPRHTCGDPTHTSPFEVFADAYFNRNGTIALWHGSRGLSGKSFTTANAYKKNLILLLNRKMI